MYQVTLSRRRRAVSLRRELRRRLRPVRHVTLPALPVLLGLHLRHPADGPVKGKELLLAGEGAQGLAGVVVVLEAEVVDQVPVLLQGLLGE